LAALLKENALGADTTRLLTTAFDQTWAKIVASQSPLAESENAHAARLILAKWMIARTRAGERDLNRLIEDAMEYMAKVKPPPP
jgi:hypothetical protein